MVIKSVKRGEREAENKTGFIIYVRDNVWMQKASTPTADDTSHCNNTLTHLTPFLKPFGCVQIFLLEGFISEGSFFITLNKRWMAQQFEKEWYNSNYGRGYKANNHFAYLLYANDLVITFI